MSDQDSNKSLLSKRLLQQEINKRTAQEVRQIAEKRRSQVSPGVQPPEADDFPTLGNNPTRPRKTFDQIMAMPAGIEQIRQLVAGGYKVEARQAIAKFLYKESNNPEAWWLYAHVAENEDQLYQILNALISLPTNPYTGRARAKLTQMPYREPTKGGMPGQRAEWVAKLLAEQFNVDVADLAQQSRMQIQVNRKVIWMGLAAMLIIILLVASFFVVKNITLSATPPSVVPTASAGDLFSYFLKVKLPISNLSSLSVPNTDWQSDQGIQFDVRQGNSKGTFVVLAYKSEPDLERDVVKAMSSDKFKKWQPILLSNLMILVSPDSASTIVDQVKSHAAQYLLAPYRSYVPTATPTQ